MFFGPSRLPGGFSDLQPAGVLVALAVSHGASFFFDYAGREEYLETTPDDQMFAPYARVVVLHVAIIGGAVLSALLGTPLVSLIIMVVLETALDLLAHVREHLKAQRAAPAG